MNKTGMFCNQTIDYCKLGDWCTLYNGYNKNISCSPNNATIQKSTGNQYECIGNCDLGFSKNLLGACEGIFYILIIDFLIYWTWND